MSIFRHDTLGSWTLGGQAFVHNVPVTNQVFHQRFWTGPVIWIGGTIWHALENSTAYERYVLEGRTSQHDLRHASWNQSACNIQDFINRAISTSSENLLAKAVAHRTPAALDTRAIHCALLSGVLVGAAWIYFARTDRHLGSDRFPHGGRFASRGELKRRLFAMQKECPTVVGIRIPAALESEYIVISGDPSTGKTNALSTVLERSRTSGWACHTHARPNSYIPGNLGLGRREESPTPEPYLNLIDPCHGAGGASIARKAGPKSLHGRLNPLDIKQKGTCHRATHYS